MIRALVFGDLHLGPSTQRDPLDRVDAVPSEIDLIVTLGDVIDDNREHAAIAETGAAYERRGRAFCDVLETRYDCPVIAVPGNHDPIACTERLVEERDGVVVGHDRVVTASDFAGGHNRFDGLEFVTLGCEQFDLTPSFDYTAFQELDPRENATSETIDYHASETAEQVERALGRYLAGLTTAEKAAATLEITPERKASFLEDIAALHETYERYSALLERTDGPTVVFAHESPFFVSFDYHHSWAGLDQRLHRGSIPLKLALLEHAPFAVLCGHLHNQSQDVIETANSHTHVYNPGERGVVVAEFDPDRGVFRVCEQ